MTIQLQPPAIHNVYNPAMLILQKEVSDPEEITITIEGAFGIITRKREFLNDVIKFNMSAILQLIDSGERTLVDAALNETPAFSVYAENSLFIPYTVKSNETTLFSAVAIKGVSQQGKSIDVMQGNDFRFLTGFEKIRIYEGSENESLICFIISSNTEVDVVSMRSFRSENSEYYDSKTIQKDKVLSCWIPAPANPIYKIGLCDASVPGQSCFIEKPIEYVTYDCIPVNPFFVRWRNQMCGYDQWMFSVSQTKYHNFAASEVFTPVIDDIETESTIEKVIDASAKNKIKVGSGNLNRNEYEEIRKIIYSPQIEFFDKSINKWIEIRVDNTDLENQTDQVFSDIELTFILPDTQLQL